jgi:hypothetical protein
VGGVRVPRDKPCAGFGGVSYVAWPVIVGSQFLVSLLQKPPVVRRFSLRCSAIWYTTQEPWTHQELESERPLRWSTVKGEVCWIGVSGFIWWDPAGEQCRWRVDGLIGKSLAALQPWGAQLGSSRVARLRACVEGLGAPNRFRLRNGFWMGWIWCLC